MYEDLQPLPVEDYLETENYSLTILRCNNKKKLILLIKESSGKVISEPFADEFGFLDSGLGKVYNECKRKKLQGKNLETFLENYFRANESNVDRMFVG